MNGAGRVCVEDCVVHALRGDRMIVQPSVLYSSKFAPGQMEASCVAELCSFYFHGG